MKEDSSNVIPREFETTHFTEEPGESGGDGGGDGGGTSGGGVGGGGDEGGEGDGGTSGGTSDRVGGGGDGAENSNCLTTFSPTEVTLKLSAEDRATWFMFVIVETRAVG